MTRAESPQTPARDSSRPRQKVRQKGDKGDKGDRARWGPVAKGIGRRQGVGALGVLEKQGRGARRTRRCPDRGSATVSAVGAIAVLCVIFGALLAVGQAAVIRQRAAAAADLAALAAADHWTAGTETACAAAERVALAQGTRLVRCVVEGEVSDVRAASGRGPFSAEVRSRAGPAGPVPPGPAGPVPPGAPAADPR